MSQLISSSGEPRSGLADFIPFVPSTRLSKSVAQSINNAATTLLTWDIEDIDTDNLHDLVTNPSRITIKTAGRYLIGASVDFFNNATGYRDMRIIKNGVTGAPIEMASVPAVEAVQDRVISTMSLQDCAVGDYFEVYATQTSTVALNVGTVSHFYATYIGPGFNAVRAKPVVSYVTPVQFAALTPLDGDEVYLVVDATNGVVWHMRYNAGSSSAYKWEFLGGSELRSEIASAELSTSVTQADLATVGPSITIPRSGDYHIHASAEGYSGAGSAVTFMWLKLGAAAYASSERIGLESTGSISPAAGARAIIRTLSAGDVVKCGYSVSTGTGTFANRTLQVQPVRIS